MTEILTGTDKASHSYLSCALVVIAVMVSQVVFAADAHRLELKDFPDLVGTSELVQASDVAISPDGKWVAYTVTSKSLVTRETKQRLFVQPFEGGEVTQIGPADSDNTGANWSPDSSKLLFFSASNGRTCVALWNVADKKTRVTDITPGLPAQWLPDSTRFVIGIRSEKQAPAKASDPKSPTPVILTASDTNHRLPGGHYLGVFAMSTWSEGLSFAIVDASSGTARTVAKNMGTGLYSYQISPDGLKLLYIVHKGSFDYDSNNRVLYDIHVIDLQDGSTTVVAEDLLGYSGAPPEWSHNSKMLAVIGGTIHDDTDSLPLGSRANSRPSRCYVIDVGRPGVLRAVGPRSFSRYFPPRWANDDSSLYQLAYRNETEKTPPKIIKLNVATGATEVALSMPLNSFDFEIAKGEQGNLYITDMNKGGENTQVFAFNLRSDQLTTIIEAKQTINSLSISAAGTRFAYLTVDSSHPTNASASDARGKAHALTHLDLNEEQRRKLGETRSISWEFNGSTRYGTVWLPANYREGQRYPTIVEVYPGNQGSGVRNLFRGDPFSDALIWQAFSASGYVVFWPDFSLRVGEGSAEIAAQIIPALDKIVELGIADPNGLGVYGRSHGGYATYSLITETQRFRAAIPAVGDSNFFTAYGALGDDGSPYMLGLTENDFLGVSPWQNRDLYIKNSPYFNFEKVTTPVLIQYGEKDQLFAWTSREAFVALRRLGKTATLLGYPDEGHGVNVPENQIDFTNRALDLFDQYLKPKTSTEAHAK